MANTPAYFQILLEKSAHGRGERNRPVARKFQCSLCQSDFFRINQFFEHLQTAHECPCGVTLVSLENHTCGYLRTQAGGGASRAFNPISLDLGVFSILTQAHSGAILLFDVHFPSAIVTFEDSFEYVYPSLTVLLPQLLKQQRGIQVSISLDVTLERLKDGHSIERKFYSPYATIINENFIKSRIDASLQYLLLSLSLYQEGESGWRLNDVHRLELKIVSYKPDLRRGRGYIETPPELRRCNILNIRSKSSSCFLLHVIAGLYGHLVQLPETNLEWHQLNHNQKRRLKRLREKDSSYMRIFNDLNKRNSVDFSNHSGSVALSAIPSFETRSEVSINVFEYNKGQVFPIYTSQVNSPRKVNLLYLTKTMNGSMEGHYCLIRNLGTLAQRKNFNSMSACFHCFHRYTEGKERHLGLCQKANTKRVTFPKEDGAVFDQFHMYLPINFKIFYTLFPGQATGVVPESTTFRFTTTEGNRHVLGFALSTFDCDHQLSHRHSYFGPAAMEMFIQCLVEQIESCNRKTTRNCLKIEKPKELKETYKDVATCMVCKEEFNSSDRRPHLHHHHLSLRSDYFKIQKLCAKCNMKIVKTSSVAISHNFSQRDAQLILSCLNATYLKKVKIIAKSSTEIISLNFMKSCRFICSSRLLNFPLNDLVERLGSHEYSDPLISFWPMEQCFSKEMLEIARKPLPQIRLLQRGNGSDENSTLLNKLGCKSPIDYYREHLEIATLQLASVVLHFDKFCFDRFRLSPLHCPSLPSYSYCVAMEHSRATFEFVKDEEMIQFIELGIRGPIETSNIKLTKSHNKEQSDADTQIMLIDYSSFYPSAYANALPTGNYAWLSEEELLKFDLKTIDDDVGYLLSVDIVTPDHLMEELDCLPLAPSKRFVSANDLSSAQLEAVEKSVGGRRGLGNEVLSLDFFPKHDYVIYHKTLAYYLSRGMQLLKIRRGIRFDQSPMLKEYSEQMIRLRHELKCVGDELGAMIIKQMLCFFFGRMLMNDRCFTDIRPCTTKEDCIRQAALHTFTDVTILGSNCSLFHHGKCTVRYSSPLLWGQVCLDLSKIQLYEGLRRFKETFPGTKLILAQTDSLLMKIPFTDGQFLEGMKLLRDMFDFSTVPVSHKLYDTSNEGKSGVWKIVDMDISEAISVKTCVYSYIQLCEGCSREFSSNCNVCTGKSSTPGLPSQYKRLASHTYFRQLLNTYSAEHSTIAVDSIFNSKKFGFHNLNTRRYLNADGNTSTAFNNVSLRNGRGSV